ncbi:MAG: T9SS type A sorting domain-containing protein [Bacteroidota bacterium]
MRFKSVLLLLFLTGALFGQSNCLIADLTATLVASNPNTPCQYFISLSFQHTATTNQYTVTGNGNNYGTFSYSQDPVTLGPFTAGNTPITREFVVRDAVFQDCQDQVTIEIPACSTAPCEISNLTVQPGDCNSNAGTYNLTLNFQVANPTNSKFELWAGNGVYLGNYGLNELPLHVSNFPWGGGTTDELRVCINDNQNCCRSLTFNAPTCFVTNPCNITNLEANADSCTSDSTYRLKLNFHVGGIALADSFALYGNGHFIKNYALSQLPVTVPNFHWDGGAVDYIKVCLLTPPPNVQTCCLTKEYNVPDCLNPCGINNLHVNVDSCTTDSTFRISLNFNVNDPSAVDSFDLWGNSHYLGHFGLNQLPLSLDSFLWNGLVINQIRVCAGNTPSCCKELSFLAPNCLPFGPCEVTNVFAVTGACTGDSTYKVRIFFNATNPGNGTYTAYTYSGANLGTYPLSHIPLQIDSFPWSGNMMDIIKICINPDTPGIAACCRTWEFPVPACLHNNPCEISNLTAVPSDCNPTTHTYSLTVNFQVQNPGNQFFEVRANNGVLIGTYPLSQLPLTIPNFPASGGQVDHVQVCINDHPDCCKTLEFVSPCPPATCSINNLEVTTGNCTSNTTYVLHINFTAQNPPSNVFTVFANGVLFGTYNLNQLPLTISNFPTDGGPNDVVKICFSTNVGAVTCCETKEFPVPTCLGAPCAINNLVVETGDCTGDSTYHVVINFQAVNPLSSTFTVWANGNLFGTYNLSQLPLTINNFPWNGGANDLVKVCFMNQAGVPDCCASKEFPVPACLTPGPCEVFNLTAVPSDCNPTSHTYSLVINFQVQNPGNQFFEVRANNGVLIGTYPLSQLPLTIPNFPASGGQVDHVQVCINDHPNCCRSLEFQSPCPPANCSISNLEVSTGNCTSNTTYVLHINFTAQNPPSNVFTVYANGSLFGTYNLSQLPLTISNFPTDGGPNDVVKICFVTNVGAVTCCETKEFPVPTCLGNPCAVNNLSVVTGDCTGDSTYHVVINFQAVNPLSNTFTVWANGNLFGTYNLSQLPLTINNFPWNGGVNDVVKVCFMNSAGAPDCCATKEFPVPTCLFQNAPCSITDLSVVTGDCTGDSTYHVVINFHASNQPTNVFVLFANGVVFGTYNLNQLPLTINNFPWNGGANDVVKVCFPTVPGTSECCATKEFAVPDCLGQSGPCAVSNLVVETGACTGDSTYKVVLNFTVTNPPSNTFGVWANNVFLGLYNINLLPLSIPNFPWNGGANDVVKVCFGSGGVATCCAIREFPVPDCLTQTGTCEIHNLSVTTGPCSSNTTYQVVLNFQVSNPPSNVFQVFANGVLFGTYNLSQLPLTIPNFPSDGGVNDVLKVCMAPNTPNAPACCAVKEFPVPDCVGNNPCSISELHVVHTPCLCGQFFALLSFSYQNVGTGGFDVTVNGNPAGNFPYNTPQPIILGPFVGDGVTVYHFKVTDHQHADCKAEFEMGKVECPILAAGTPVNDAKLVLSPNPAADWLNISVQMNGAAKPGQTKVDIFHADGRLVQSQIVADGSNFQLDISGMPAGMYRIALQTEAGRLEGTFAKQ